MTLSYSGENMNYEADQILSLLLINIFMSVARMGTRTPDPQISCNQSFLKVWCSTDWAMNQTCGTLLEKQRWTHKRCTLMDPHTWPRQSRTTSLERTFSSYVRIQDVVLKTYLGRWTIGRSGERGSRISVLPARYDDEYIYAILFLVNEVLQF